ncbi:hypothetical protein QBC35DRAFT_473469 [Podospora australis]|uniref:Uncharacterized protein n=1 Tax=Podospora australis TaxID=1536484 RepID=A0AAN7AHB7_9PEZI|nr:hypothetical protein QBC35DRAFT_473469 [Podospora australis]
MEDEEYYHMMLNDLEHLERVHHHVEPVPYPLGTSGLFRSSSSSAAAAAAPQEPLHNPFISGLRLAIDSAVRAGLELLQSATTTAPHQVYLHGQTNPTSHSGSDGSGSIWRRGRRRSTDSSSSSGSGRP